MLQLQRFLIDDRVGLVLSERSVRDGLCAREGQGCVPARACRLGGGKARVAGVEDGESESAQGLRLGLESTSSEEHD